MHLKIVLLKTECIYIYIYISLSLSLSIWKPLIPGIQVVLLKEVVPVFPTNVAISLSCYKTDTNVSGCQACTCIYIRIQIYLHIQLLWERYIIRLTYIHVYIIQYPVQENTHLFLSASVHYITASSNVHLNARIIQMDGLESFLCSDSFDKAIFCLGEKRGVLINDVVLGMIK